MQRVQKQQLNPIGKLLVTPPPGNSPSCQQRVEISFAECTWSCYNPNHSIWGALLSVFFHVMDIKWITVATEFLDIEHYRYRRQLSGLPIFYIQLLLLENCSKFFISKHLAFFFWKRNWHGVTSANELVELVPPQVRQQESKSLICKDWT